MHRLAASYEPLGNKGDNNVGGDSTRRVGSFHLRVQKSIRQEDYWWNWNPWRLIYVRH